MSLRTRNSDVTEDTITGKRSVSVTVLISTRNRPESLRLTLESLLQDGNLRIASWEALVITDFDCHDGTVEICKEFAERCPDRVRFLIQTTTGKSNALNLGISVARGEILALTDDDVLVAPDYIESIQKTFQQYTAEAAQGRVVLECDGGLPPWMGQRQKVFMSFCDYGLEVLDWTQRTMFGTNMVIRIEAARKVGGFSPELGAGTKMGFAEDSEFSLRLREAGCKFIYAPQILVRHQLSRKRLTPSFFRRRYFGLGRARAYIDAIERVPLWRYGLYSVKYAVLKQAEALWHRLRNRPAEALDAQCYAFQNTGFFLQHLRFWLGAPRTLSIVKDWTAEPVNCAGPGPVEAPGGRL